MSMRLTRAFASQGITDPQDARRYADQLTANGYGLGYAQLLAAASYIHWACGDTHTASRLAHDAQSLTTVERVAHAVNRVHDAVLGVEVHLEVIDLEQMAPLGDGLLL